MRQSLGELLQNEGYRVIPANGADEALEHIRHGGLDAALVDVRMPGVGGIDLLRQLRALAPDLPVIMMTGFPTVETAVLAMKYGALDFHTKPLDLRKLREQFDRILSAKAINHDGEIVPGLARILGDSPHVVKLRETIQRIAPTDASVIISGETGTGKELVADAIHYLSKRSTAPFMKINCAAIPDTLLESELFGHERGAFTGADAQKPGLFETARNGTVFLDEIGDMDIRLQAKLLRILQGGEFRRVGGTKDLVTNVRVIAASNKDLVRMIRDGSFREDLYYRLSVISIKTAPLRDCLGDIPILAAYFVPVFARAYGKETPVIGDNFLRVLGMQPWTGNVREFKNCIERAVIFCDGGPLGTEHLPGQYNCDVPQMYKADSRLSGKVPGGISRGAVERFPAHQVLSDPPSEPSSVSMSEARDEVERLLIAAAITKAGGNRTKAAQLLGIHRRTLYNKLEKLGSDGDAQST